MTRSRSGMATSEISSFPSRSYCSNAFSSSEAYSIALVSLTNFFFHRIKSRYRALLTVRASTRPLASTPKIVIGMYARNLPRIPGSTIIGINATMVVITPDKIGIPYSRSASRIAVLGSYPTRIFAEAAWTITIMVSTAIPKERIREKFVRKFREYPKKLRSKKVQRKASGSVRVAKSESWKPINNHITKNTRARVTMASLASSA